ncbi:hypothetical protein [Agrobacterium sp.]|uniref:hypothetical protein n=1 Tax=Agrobacterium sp. TaxID=361 RepID=UPI0028AEA367|nr:hypothetical protein [Agrobacterium sp.]
MKMLAAKLLLNLPPLKAQPNNRHDVRYVIMKNPGIAGVFCFWASCMVVRMDRPIFEDCQVRAFFFAKQLTASLNLKNRLPYQAQREAPSGRLPKHLAQRLHRFWEDMQNQEATLRRYPEPS